MWCLISVFLVWAWCMPRLHDDLKYVDLLWSHSTPTHCPMWDSNIANVRWSTPILCSKCSCFSVLSKWLIVDTHWMRWFSIRCRQGPNESRIGLMPELNHPVRLTWFVHVAFRLTKCTQYQARSLRSVEAHLSTSFLWETYEICRVIDYFCLSGRSLL